VRLTDLAIRRPVLAIVLNLLLIVFGLIAFQRLQLREYPDINPPVVSVLTVYPGAAAQVVETRITQIIEDAVSGIEGIDFMESASADGRSTINITFNLERDVDAAAADVRDRVSRVLGDLPEEADPPEVVKVDANADPVMWLNLSSPKHSQMELTDYAERYLVDRLSAVPGVARVRLGGTKTPAMRIWLDRQNLAAHGMTAADVEAALRRENIELPGGRIESVTREFAVRTLRPYVAAEDFAALVIGKGADGHLIRIGDVAHVEIAPEQTRSEVRGDRVPLIGIGIIKLSQANTLDVARGVEGTMDALRTNLPDGMQLIRSYDSSIFIAAAIEEVYFTFALAIVLVVLVIYLFLGSVRAMLIPAVTVPVSLIASFSVLLALGFSLNVLTMLALVLAIGLVVDDAIVVLENIYRRLQDGEPPLLAAERGSRQVVFAVIATTLTVIAVFIPITLVDGDLGRLFTEFAVALSAAVGFSSIVALTLSPVMCAALLKHEIKPTRFNRWLDAHFERLSARYARSVARLLPHRMGMLAVLLLSGLACVLLFRHLPQEYAPVEDRGTFFIFMNGPEGASFETMRKAGRQMEDAVMPLVESGEAMRVNALIPRGQEGVTDTVNNGLGIVVMQPWGERTRSTQAAMAEVTQRMSDTMPGVRAYAIMRPGLSTGGTGQPVQFVLAGSDYAQLTRWRDLLLAEARGNPGLRDIDWDYKETKPQLLVTLARDRAADLGVSLETVARTLETMLAGRRVTTFQSGGEEYDVILEIRPEDKQSIADLRNIYVKSISSDALVPLSNLVTVAESADSSALNRFNRLRSITISANLSEDYTLGQALEYLDATARRVLPQEAQVDYRGLSRAFKQGSSAIYFVFIMAVVIIYLVLAAQFESFLHPFTILLTVPLAVAGGLLGLWIAGGTLNIYSQIGLIMLVGLAAKNGILIVEFANQLRDEGLAIHEAVITAAHLRLRPILMTAIATLAGAVPLMFASGAGAESRFALGVVIFAGVLVATILTLFVIPVAYGVFARFTGSPEQRVRALEALQKHHQSH
jgi:multidrug efflux pump